MGTSKAFGGPKGNPTWSSLSSTVTKSVNDGHPTTSSLARVMSHMVSYLGGSFSASAGASKTGGGAGLKTARHLGSFLSDIQNHGFYSAINNLSGREGVNDAEQAVNVIIERCANRAGTLDECAAKAAIRDLLKDIGIESDNLQGIENEFNSAIEQFGITEILIKYFGNYLYQLLCNNFYEKLIKEKGIRETDNFYKDLREFIIEKTKSISNNIDLRNVVWKSNAGISLVQGIFNETLKAFENYED